jgi:hypothetical protein
MNSDGPNPIGPRPDAPSSNPIGARPDAPSSDGSPLRETLGNFWWEVGQLLAGSSDDVTPKPSAPPAPETDSSK